MLINVTILCLSSLFASDFEVPCQADTIRSGEKDFLEQQAREHFGDAFGLFMVTLNPDYEQLSEN